MSLFKKILFGIFIIIAFGLGGWAYLNLKNNKKPKVEAISVLPDSCLVYLSTSDFMGLDKKLNSQSLIVDKLKLFGDIEMFCNTLRQFDSLFNSQPMIREQISDNPIHFALYGGHLSWLAAFNVKQLGEQEKVQEEISKLLHAKTAGKDIFEFAFNRSAKFYFVIQDGVVMISSDREIIQLASNATGKKLYNNPSFIAFKNTLEENNLLSVYVNQARYQESDAAKKLNLPEICKNGFYAGVVDIQPSELKINGYLKADSASLASLLAKQEAVEPGFVSALPYSCNYFQAYGFGSFNRLSPVLDKKQNEDQKNFWKTINDSALYNLKESFNANIENYLVDFESGASEQKFILLKISDSLMAKEHLRLMSDTVTRRNDDSLFRIKTTAGGQPIMLFNQLSTCITAYAAIHQSHIYFSENADDLAQLLYNLRSNLRMTENLSFNAYRNQNFPETFNYLVYNIPSLDKTERTSFFNFEANSTNDPFENFRHFSFSITNRKQQLEFRWHLLNETETVNKEQNILWALQLDTLCTMKAGYFVNHVTKENELLVQDEKSKLYLVNAKGTILWEKRISEKITSEIFKVDIFKNNRYQMLFSTKNQLHLLDRNGNYLPGYPLRLSAESSCPLSVFDYDNTRDYRLFIACKNNKIYNYAITGKKQEGFVPFHTDNLVRLPVQYVKVGASDYLVAIDEEGKIYTLSRRGDGRIGLKNKTTANCSAFYLDATGNINSTYLFYADDKNSLISKISFADKKDIVKLNYDVENAGVNFYRTGKTVGIFFTKLNTVLAYDLNGNLLSSKTVENDLTETDFYEDENRSVYLTRSHIRDELMVIDPARQRTKLYSATALPLVCDLFNDGKKYLVVTNGSRLSCLLLN